MRINISVNISINVNITIRLVLQIKKSFLLQPKLNPDGESTMPCQGDLFGGVHLS